MEISFTSSLADQEGANSWITHHWGVTYRAFTSGLPTILERSVLEALG